jgi:SARP family transcriptional regulator, regulator of embCAB operon
MDDPVTHPDRSGGLPSRTPLRYVPRVDFRVLGPFEVVGAEGSVPLGGPKQRAVLALLLARANEAVSLDALIDGLWDEEPLRGPGGRSRRTSTTSGRRLGPIGSRAERRAISSAPIGTESMRRASRRC